MKNAHFLLVASALIMIAVSSCVPARKYEDLQAKEKACADSLQTTQSRIRDLQGKYKELSTKFDLMKKDYDILVRDSTTLGSRYRSLQSQHQMMDRNCQRIQEQLEYLQKQLERQSTSLGTELEAKKLELQRKDDELKRLELDLKKLQMELDEKARLLEQREKRVNELEDMLKKKDEATNLLKEKIATALLGFKDKGLTVEQRDGKIYVSMEAKLLFASGSIVVESEGKKAIIELAKVLQDQKDLEIIVEGHTDTDKMNASAHPKDNWELSVLRATSVVKIMLENSAMNPKKLSASGRSEYVPVDASDKARNRRIEIIIMPNLDELYKILDNK
jgi:chemotaxis protein MotB